MSSFHLLCLNNFKESDVMLELPIANEYIFGKFNCVSFLKPLFPKRSYFITIYNKRSQDIRESISAALFPKLHLSKDKEQGF